MNEPPTDVHKPLNSLKGKVVRMEAIQMGLGDEDLFDDYKRLCTMRW